MAKDHASVPGRIKRFFTFAENPHWLWGLTALFTGHWGLRYAATPTFSAKVKNVWGYTSTSSHAFIAWC